MSGARVSEPSSNTSGRFLTIKLSISFAVTSYDSDDEDTPGLLIVPPDGVVAPEYAQVLRFNWPHFLGDERERPHISVTLNNDGAMTPQRAGTMLNGLRWEHTGKAT